MSRWHVQVQHPRITRPSLTKGDGSGAVPDVLAAAIFDAAPAPPGDLVALPITTGTPTVGSPALTQRHSLTAAGLTAGTPTLGAPAFTQRQALAAQGVTTGVPVLGAPALSSGGGSVNLTALDLATGMPTLGAPAIIHVRVLAAQALTAGTPTLGSPAFTQRHALASSGLTAGTPVLGTPAAGQRHALQAQALTTAAPVLDAPILRSSHVLAATAIVAGTPSVGTPAVHTYPPEEWVAETYWATSDCSTGASLWSTATRSANLSCDIQAQQEHDSELRTWSEERSEILCRASYTSDSLSTFASTSRLTG